VAGFVLRRACPVCEQREHTVLRSLPFTAPEVWDFLERYYAGRIARDDLAGALYEIRCCAACGFLWQAYHLDADGMQRLYEEWIGAEESLSKKTLADVSLFEGYAREASSIAHRLGRKPCELNVLDFGMGWGAWCRMAQAYGYTVSGFELSQRRRQHARAWSIRVIDSLESLERYDYISCQHTLEHVPDPLATLTRLVGSLAPGGLLRLSVPDGLGMKRQLAEPGWRAAKDPLHPLEHLNCFTGDTLGRLAARAGLAAAPERPAARGLRGLVLGALRAPRGGLQGTSHCFARAGA
jgi:SAM-dependent methyltransferase